MAIARTDFFLDPSLRLTEEERALVAAMLGGLIEEIADELRAGLPPLEAARADWRRHELVHKMQVARLLDRDSLFALLLRRADENRVSSGDGETLTAMVGSADGEVASAAMGLIVARGRRRDRFGRLGLDLDDLDADEAVALIHSTAAALRDNVGDGSPDAMMAATTRMLIARLDENHRLDSAVADLANTLSRFGRSADQALLHALANEGEVALLAALLADRAAIATSTAWDLLIGDDDGGLALLLRLAACGRTLAATIIAALAPRLGHDEIALIDRFDEISDEDVAARQAWWRLDPAYRDACRQLDEIDAHHRV